MSCPRCDASPEQTEARERSAKCKSCGLVFDPLRLHARSARPVLAPASALEALAVPFGFEALERKIGLKSVYRDARSGKGELVITRRWAHTTPAIRSNVPVPLLPPILILFAVFGMFFVAHAPGPGSLIGLAHVCFGLIGAYSVVLWLKNVTRIAVEDGRLRISHSPLPWLGARDVDAASVEQLFCDSGGKGRDGGETFRVLAFFRGHDEPVVLVKDLADASHALFLEEAIERSLGIQDRPVEAELPFKRNRAAAGRR